jgi:hypothetical protein
MEFKFKKGMKVHLIFGDPDLVGRPTTQGPGLVVTDRRINQGEPEYKVKFFTGWWNEECLQEV